MPQCARCESTIDSGGGLLSVIGLDETEGWECPECGTVYCDDCIQERKLKMISDYDCCRDCGTLLEHR